MSEEKKSKLNLVLLGNTLYEEVLDADGKPQVDENNRRIRRRVPGSEIRIVQWVKDDGDVANYTAEVVIAGKRFVAFLNKVDKEVEEIKRALENADESVLLKVKKILGVDEEQ